MKKVIYVVIYIICLIITIYIFGNYQKKLFILRFNNEKIWGEITNIEYVHRPNRGSYNKIYYIFDYNGEKYNKSFTKNTDGLLGILNDFNSLIMHKYYRAGQKIQILYNNELKFSYANDELSSQILMIIILIISTPFIALIIIIGLANELIKELKIRIKVFSNKKIFYIQYNNYKIKETVINGEFDYKKLILNNLIDGTIICYGIKKGNNFIELSYFNDDYIFRINKNGKENEIVNNKNQDVKEHFKELVNGV